MTFYENCSLFVACRASKIQSYNLYELWFLYLDTMEGFDSIVIEVIRDFLLLNKIINFSGAFVQISVYILSFLMFQVPSSKIFMFY